jgi:hypothetical protein
MPDVLNALVAFVAERQRLVVVGLAALGIEPVRIAAGAYARGNATNHEASE